LIFPDHLKLLKKFSSEAGMSKYDIRVVEGMQKSELFGCRKMGGCLSGHSLTGAAIRLGKHYSCSVSSRAQHLHLRYIRRHYDRYRNAEYLARSSQPLSKVTRGVGDNPISAFYRVEILQPIERASNLE
jgi:hypothetical protein